MIRKAIFICNEQVEKTKKMLSNFVRREYSVERSPKGNHNLVKKVSGPKVWVQWAQCDNLNIANILEVAGQEADHFVGLIAMKEIPKVALVIKVHTNGWTPIYLAYRETTNSSEQIAESEQLSKVLEHLL